MNLDYRTQNENEEKTDADVNGLGVANYSQYVFFVWKTLRKSFFLDIPMEELCLKFNLKYSYSSGLVLLINLESRNDSHTWFVMDFVVQVFIVAFRRILKEENPKMKWKVRFCGLTSCFTLLVEWRNISYALKSFKHILRNYWAHYTKETKATFKTAFTIHKCTKCWPVRSSKLWQTEHFCCVFITVSQFLGNLYQ